MIKITLDEPMAFAVLSEVQLKAASSVDKANAAVRIGSAVLAKYNSDMAQRWTALAMTIQGAIIAQRFPRKVHLPQSPSD